MMIGSGPIQFFKFFSPKMAWLSRKVRAVSEYSVFAGPAPERRQLTVVRLEVRVFGFPSPFSFYSTRCRRQTHSPTYGTIQVERLGQDASGVNILVVPIPR